MSPVLPDSGHKIGERLSQLSGGLIFPYDRPSVCCDDVLVKFVDEVDVEKSGKVGVCVTGLGTAEELRLVGKAPVRIEGDAAKAAGQRLLGGDDFSGHIVVAEEVVAIGEVARKYPCEFLVDRCEPHI